MKLVLIHGRAQEGRDPQELRSEWKKALIEGMLKNGHSLPDDFPIELLYYGQKLDSLVKPEQAGDQIEGVIARGPSEDRAAVSFITALLDEMRQALGIETSDVNANLPEGVIERGIMNTPFMLALARTIDQRTRWGLGTIQRFTYDVFLYLTKSGVREAVDIFIKGAFTDEECVVVGHSLGSVVGYNVLHQLISVPVKKYVTVGSPLGIRAIQDQLSRPLSVPGCIGNWYNARDPRDTVALFPLDETHFPGRPGGRGIRNKNDVVNQTANRHSIEGYLNDADVAREIYEALTGVA